MSLQLRLRTGFLVAVCAALPGVAGCTGSGETPPPAESPGAAGSPPAERRADTEDGDGDGAGGASGDERVGAADGVGGADGAEEASVRPAPALRATEPDEVGMDSERLDRLDMTIFGGIADGATPGAALAVARSGRAVRMEGYGRTDWAGDAPPVTDSTIYDLASLTKAVGTTTAVMLLLDDGRIDLDAPIARYLPEWRGDGWKARVTPRHLLTHTSGLPAFRALWRTARGREAFLREIAALELEHEPGAATEYSDLGMILLGLVAERIAREPIDVFLETHVFDPLDMADTGYSPLQTGWAAKGMTREDVEARILPRIAPTEVDTLFRRTHVHGVVHDENAFAMGGVAGHAGLFSSARDMAVFAQMLLNGGVHRGRRVLRAATVRAFTTRQDAGSTRALGWDTPGPESSAGSYFSRDSFGHTGFTGTSLWVDRRRDLVVVLLMNRVNPTRENRKYIELRRSVHDRVQRALLGGPTGEPRDGSLEDVSEPSPDDPGDRPTDAGSRDDSAD